MSDAAESVKAPKSASTPIHYELPVGAIMLLESVLGQSQWYKEDPKAGYLVVRAVQAADALPDLPEKLKVESGESQDDFDKRFDAWADPVCEFQWTEKQREAVKVCVRFFLKQGAFVVTKHLVSLLRLLGLDEE